MWFEEREGREQPFVARWRMPGGKKEARSFASAADRADFAEAWAKARRAYGTTAATLSPREAEALARFREITGGADLLTVASEWVAMRGVVDGRITLKDAVSRYQAATEGQGSPESRAQRDLQLDRLLAAFPSARLADLTAEKIVAWLAELAPPRAGGEAAPRTKRAHRGTLARLLDYAVGAGWLTRSPMSAVPIPKPEAEEVTLLTVQQARDLFAAAAGLRCVGRLALEAFAGIRFSSAQRIAEGDLDRIHKGITFPGSKHKTGRRHYVEGFPDNLWAWIASAPASGWAINPRLYALDKRAVFEAAGLKGEGKDAEALRNCLRHSFATYHLALHRDAAKTAYLLTHSKPTMLYQHYAGRATKADAEAYFSIVP